MNTSVRTALVCFALASFGMDAEASVRAYRPIDEQQVLLRLDGAGGETLLEQRRRAYRSAPRDPEALASYVRALIEAGTRTGDERNFGYAEQVLGKPSTASDPQLALLRAQLLQHRHDFSAADAQLSAILERSPRDRAARLMRAQVRLHLKQPEKALADCVAVTPLVDLLTATTCIAQSRAASGDLTRAYELVITALSGAGADSKTRSWSAGVAAEFAARLGDSRAADQWYREAWGLDTDSHYVRVSYADWLLSQGAHAQALRVARAGTSNADRTRAVLAAQSRESLEARRLQLLWREADARGERAHLRDLARFHWLVLHDVRGAHAVALDNFRDHQDAEDALVLATTAAATRDQFALAQIDRWRRTTRYEDARLDRLLGEAG
jgi:predicted Zn-dependent protease